MAGMLPTPPQRSPNCHQVCLAFRNEKIICLFLLENGGTPCFKSLPNTNARLKKQSAWISLISSVSFFHAGREQRCIYRKQQRPLRMQYVHPWENKGQGKESQCVALANLCTQIIHEEENWEISNSLLPAYFQTLNVDCCPFLRASIPLWLSYHQCLLI